MVVRDLAILVHILLEVLVLLVKEMQEELVPLQVQDGAEEEEVLAERVQALYLRVLVEALD